MVLVVVLHVDYALAPHGGGIPSVIDDALRPVRMPAFFALAGMLAAGAAARPLSVSPQRTIRFVYLSALWSMLFLAPYLTPANPNRSRPTVESVAMWMFLPGQYWFLWALAVYFVFARLTRDIQARYMVPFLLALAVAGAVLEMRTVDVSGIEVQPLHLGNVLANFVWYYLGLNFRSVWLTMIARGRRSGPMATCAFVYLSLFIVANHFDVVELSKTFLTPVALLGVMYACGAATFTSAPARFVAWIGRGTLPVYLLQMPGLIVLSQLVQRTVGLAWVTWQPVGSLGVVGLALSLTVFARLLGTRLENSTRLRWLMHTPRRRSKMSASARLDLAT